MRIINAVGYCVLTFLNILYLKTLETPFQVVERRLSVFKKIFK